MFDFNKLDRPVSKKAILDPLEIFAKTPNLNHAPNDLWKGQAEALTKWHESRSEFDNAIVLNTGAGKSLVGILIAQSLVNENSGPVVYACSTIDLVDQTVKECARLGIPNSTRAHGSFNNDLFETGNAFCITTYQALFTAMTVFNGDKAPSAVVFDDAHVAERLIRDSFTLTINKSKHQELYTQLVEIVRPEFAELDKNARLQFVLDSVGQQNTILCPPATAYRSREKIIAALNAANYRKTELKFSVAQLYQNIGHCAILISPEIIEITPPFIPTGIFDFLNPPVRRVYLSATLQFETDFIRGFGKGNVNRIEPDNDAGNGERLIILANNLAKETDKLELSKELLQSQKVLISVPSYRRAMDWKEINTPPEPEKFSSELEAFRHDTKGSFILVSRIDGIDLPQDTCRVMMIDGAPYGASLLDRHQFVDLKMSNLFSTKMASRITQLLGRINRGRSDYGAFILIGKDINNWLKTERNVALLPPLIRKQVILGGTVQDGMEQGDSAEVSNVIKSVLARDEGWLKFYRETIDGLEVSEDAINTVTEREGLLVDSAIAECQFMTRLWQGDIDGARSSILDKLDTTALADARLAGWHSLWLGMTYEIEDDSASSISQYKKARSRLSSWLNVPYKSEQDFQVESDGANTTLQQTLQVVNKHGPMALNDLIAKLKVQVRKLKDTKMSSSIHEESLRTFGELLGFVACRPDNEHGAGPDVVWYDPQTNDGLAFELKTLKKSPAKYNKEDIGQALNHIEWLAENMNEQKFDGLLITGPTGFCSSKASPSDTLFHVESNQLCARLYALIASIEDTVGKTAVERWTLISSLGELLEWQIEGWFQILAQNKMKDLPSE